ncbi:unnamed protein product [Cuscuta campestris]|uniref:Uncharacterized protein n=1 Tax=Cuscuta campestris TaxID=132261 RepID=A0A484KCB4_9ASTE|nr:unnamed protein product [Cuscuta campestris]
MGVYRGVRRDFKTHIISFRFRNSYLIISSKLTKRTLRWYQYGDLISPSLVWARKDTEHAKSTVYIIILGTNNNVTLVPQRLPPIAKVRGVGCPQCLNGSRPLRSKMSRIYAV